jgi:hypothetical protein
MKDGGVRWGTVGNGGERWGTVGNGGERWGTVGNGGERWGRWGTERDGGGRRGTVGNDEGLWCHDDGLWVTLAKTGNGTVTVKGQNHNFYCIILFGLTI